MPKRNDSTEPATPLMFFDLPVEENKKAQTFSTTALVLIFISFIFSWKGLHSQSFLENGAFYPSDPFRRFGLTLLTSVFLHARFAHLFSNMYFLYLGSDDVEEIKGAPFTLVLFFVSALAGHFIYTIGGGINPTIGASGGVAGVMTYYALAFPYNRFRFLSFYPGRRRYHSYSYRSYTTYSIPAWGALVAFCAVQFLNYRLTRDHATSVHVNYLAHLGGVAAGLVAYVLSDQKK
jgi:membrane associated rhomboid family serine protease